MTALFKVVHIGLVRCKLFSTRALSLTSVCQNNILSWRTFVLFGACFDRFHEFLLGDLEICGNNKSSGKNVETNFNIKIYLCIIIISVKENIDLKMFKMAKQLFRCCQLFKNSALRCRKLMIWKFFRLQKYNFATYLKIIFWWKNDLKIF